MCGLCAVTLPSDTPPPLNTSVWWFFTHCFSHFHIKPMTLKTFDQQLLLQKFVGGAKERFFLDRDLIKGVAFSGLQMGSV